MDQLLWPPAYRRRVRQSCLLDRCWGRRICGTCCIAICFRSALSHGYFYLVSMWSRKGNKPAAGSVAVELDRHTCLDPHATAIGMNMQCGPQSADKIAACQDFWK
ncbi:unnamed protein product, partial [Prorocentrum cordatum]